MRKIHSRNLLKMISSLTALVIIQCGCSNRHIAENTQIGVGRDHKEYSIGEIKKTIRSRRIIDAPYIPQGEKYPNGCESVSAVMALEWAGINIGVDEFIDIYLDMGEKPNLKKDALSGKLYGVGPDPTEVYCGDPRSDDGWGCYAPVIKSALARALSGNGYRAAEYDGVSLDWLCRKFIDNNIPVIVWATVGMVYSDSPGSFAEWVTPEGKTILYNLKLHCMLLVGYDDEKFYFNDPLTPGENGDTYIGYPQDEAKKAYNLLGCQCVVIYPKISSPVKSICNK